MKCVDNVNIEMDKHALGNDAKEFNSNIISLNVCFAPKYGYLVISFMVF